MTVRRKHVAWAAVVLLVGAAAFHLLQLQIAFVNVGQEFGAYGQYHRVLRVVRGLPEYTVVSRRVSRKLELRHLFHVEEFAIVLRDAAGRTGEVRFVKGSAEMAERDEATLARLVHAKFDAAATGAPPDAVAAALANDASRASALVPDSSPTTVTSTPQP